MLIKKGDNIKVIAGKDRGKTGSILRIEEKSGRVAIEGVNLYKKHKKPTKQGQKGEIVSIARSMNASNVMLVCKSCGRATRIGNRIEGEKKIRYCKKCQSVIN